MYKVMAEANAAAKRLKADRKLMLKAVRENRPEFKEELFQSELKRLGNKDWRCGSFYSRSSLNELWDALKKRVNEEKAVTL